MRSCNTLTQLGLRPDRGARYQASSGPIAASCRDSRRHNLLTSGCLRGDATGRESISIRVAASTNDARAVASRCFYELNQRFSAAQNAYRNGIATDQELRVAFRAFTTPIPRWVRNPLPTADTQSLVTVRKLQ
jgi:hypothetical protein